MNPIKIKRSEDHRDIEKVMSIVATFGSDPKNLIATREYISNELKELGENRLLYLLEDHTRVIGMVQLILKNADNDSQLANGRNVAHVHALQISKDLHRKGFGNLIMQQLEDEALNLGLDQLTLGVDGDNEKALNLYKKLGYSLMKEVEGRSPEVKLFYMQKRLN